MELKKELSIVGAIPTSDMPGHQHLHNRVCSALDYCQESEWVEFKQSADWDSLKYKLTKTVMGMANQLDGGVIIVGASESGGNWDLSGIREDHLATYNVDDIIAFINKYASPALRPDVVVIKYTNGNQFLAIQVPEFDDIPIVCQLNGPNGQGIVEGAVYIRSHGKAETRRITSAADMHDLLVLAAEKRARKMLEQSQRIGMVPGSSSENAYKEELGEI